LTFLTSDITHFQTPRLVSIEHVEEAVQLIEIAALHLPKLLEHVADEFQPVHRLVAILQSVAHLKYGVHGDALLNERLQIGFLLQCYPYKDYLSQAIRSHCDTNKHIKH
jgi:hypothetical protein